MAFAFRANIVKNYSLQRKHGKHTIKLFSALKNKRKY